jgi:MarR family transcriptional regulator, 2-MHQ and catechol-resistance regulon repressor
VTDLEDRRLTAMGLLVEVSEGVTARLDEVHARRGLSGTEFDVLIRVARSPNQRLRMSDLAAQTALSTSGITRIVDRLVAKGVVRREPAAGDRRSWLAVLTDMGRGLLDAHVPDVIEAIRRWFTGPLTPDELAALLETLRMVRGRVRPDAVAGAAEGRGAAVTQ